MTNYTKLAATLTSGTLIGCTPFSTLTTQSAPVDQLTRSNAQAAPRIEAFQRTNSLVSEVEGLFLSARAAHGGGQLAMAQESYAKVLEKNPNHIGALNSMAVIYAQSGKLEQSMAMFEQALALEPKAAHIHNNLGYAHLLGGRLDQAEAAFKTALELNSTSQMALKNMALLVQARGKDTVVVVKADKPVGADVSAPAPAVGATLVVVAPSIYELKDQASLKPAAPVEVVAKAASASALMPAVEAPMALKMEQEVASLPQLQAIEPVIGVPYTQAVSAPVVTLLGIRLEVSNGVGIRNLAKRTAQRLAPLGLVATRLTNQPGYKQARTEIQYSAGLLSKADALSAKLPVTIKVNPANDLSKNVQMRLILGHDVAGQAIARWLDAPHAPVLALSRSQGWLWS